MKKILFGLMKLSTSMAFVFTVLNVNATCGACYHQDKLPASAMKYKR